VCVDVGRDGRERRQHLVGQPLAVGVRHRRGPDADDHLVAVELLERDDRLVARRRADGVVQQRLDLAGLDVRPQARSQVDPGGLLERHDGRAEHDVVGDHDRVLALGEGRVEEPERAHDALELAGEPAGLEPHAVAHPERPSRDQDHAGDQVAERLLRREAEDHGGDRAADGQRLRADAREREARGGGRGDEREADQEPDRAGRGRVHAAEEPRGAGAADVARQQPAEHDHHHGGGDADRRVGAEELLALDVGEDRQAEQRQEHQELHAGLLGALRGLERELARAGRSEVGYLPGASHQNRVP
jgi:hypothetical protein